MLVPLSEISAIFPKNLMNPFGTTSLYSYQKSNKSPIKNKSFALDFIESKKEIIFLSLFILSDLSSDELKEALEEITLSNKEADEIIMSARSSWFDDDKKEENNEEN